MIVICNRLDICESDTCPHRKPHLKAMICEVDQCSHIKFHKLDNDFHTECKLVEDFIDEEEMTI
jgi:hypothetical protein